MRWIAVLLLSALPAFAEGERAGEFDYYVLSLSWSPSWCALEGEARGAEQCAPGQNTGWVLHGLWPQYDEGWPSFCLTGARDPSRHESAVMADIMGSSGLAWYQWKKHGRCSGLSAADYFATARRAWQAVVRPPLLESLHRPVQLHPQVVEEAFIEVNPGWEPDMLTITCKEGRIQEARLCLTRDLEPRACGSDVVRDCTLPGALFDPPR